MKFDFNKKEEHSRGEIFTLTVYNKNIDVLLTTHANERATRWELTHKQVFETILDPEEVVLGHRNRYIAHRRFEEHLVRVIYEYEETLPVIVTVYYPYSKRYFQGGGSYEDKILS